MNNYKRAYVIVNPKNDRYIIDRISYLIQRANLDWQVFTTTPEPNSAYNLALDAIAARVDAVIVYGGDGTIMECASATVNQIPLGILPGGTLNIVAHALNIPLNLDAALALIYQGNNTVRHIDVGQISTQNIISKTFLVRASSGYEAASVARISPEARKREGQDIAFARTYIWELLKNRFSNCQFKLTLDDGKTIKVRAKECIIANSGILKREPNNVIALDDWSESSCDIEDGLLNIILLNNQGLNIKVIEQHLAREIIINASPPQDVQCDGEFIGKTPFTVRVLPNALSIISPAYYTHLNKHLVNNQDLYKAPLFKGGWGDQKSPDNYKLQYTYQKFTRKRQFPKDFIYQERSNNNYVTSLAYGNGKWTVVVSNNTGFCNQIYISESEFPQNQIQKYWEEDYYITSLAYGNGKWIVVMSKQAIYSYQNYQTYIIDTYPRQNLIKEQLERGLSITAAAYGNGQWVIVISVGTGIANQTYFIKENFPVLSLRESLLKNQQYITCLASDAEKLLIVASQDTNFSKQVYVTRTYFPNEAIQQYLKQSYFITDIVYRYGSWTVVLSVFNK
jgi:diacylglycerol kinase family enzyme